MNINNYLLQDKHVVCSTIEFNRKLGVSKNTQEEKQYIIMIVNALYEEGFIPSKLFMKDIKTLPEDTLKNILDIIISAGNTVNAKPMYYNFPQEVINMSELEFRFDQIIHYITGLVPSDYKGKSEQSREDIQTRVVSLTEVNLIPNLEPVSRGLLQKNSRLTDRDIRYLESKGTLIQGCLEDIQIPFKENMYIVIDIIINSDIDRKDSAIQSIISRPKDIIEYINVRTFDKRFKTSQKRVFANVLNSFATRNYDGFANEIANNQKKSIIAFQAISVLRFLEPSHSMSKLVKELRNGQLNSFMSDVEKSYVDGDIDKLMVLLENKPTILLESLNRIAGIYGKEGVEIACDTLSKNIGDVPVRKMVTFINAFYNPDETGFKDSVQTVQTRDRSEPLYYLKRISGGKKLITMLIKSFVKNNDTFKEINGQFNSTVNIKIPSNLNLSESILMVPDKTGNPLSVPQGLAYNIAPDERIRTFTYWDNSSSQVDIDLHANLFNKEKRGIGHVGWSGSKNDFGVTHSGDLIHNNSAEYIDFQLQGSSSSAKENGVSYISSNIHVFSGQNFSNIDTSLYGIMLIKDNESDSKKLYQPNNCLFSTELISETRRFDDILIDVEKSVVRTSKKYTDINFSYKTFIELLFHDKEIKYVEIDKVKEEDDSFINLFDINFFQ